MKYFICIIIAILQISCSIGVNDKIKFQYAVREVFSDVDLNNIDYLVIIPSQGCGGCITGAENYYMENRKNRKIKFIFTNIISMKTLKQKINIDPHSVFLDKDNIFLTAYPVEKQIYPVVLKLKNLKITAIYFQSPESDAFGKIKKSLL
ncbi:hypothetical protein Palpr_1560 [Paludibacter propionicigenes WB4]|uniref:Uncharacterized protein n=1 Tax=Paludibacter propionicigenes (strain DSM 17365 / JCM 13257 / WB4) TaxID=694427 RepID=E4T4R1_PALPW|nr:hypothetical protein [Paludibacter propionicigenes]ADQ79705.1 hypothetical protein Palpr_1560 [Paludibacter propionicigenes WB4]